MNKPNDQETVKIKKSKITKKKKEVVPEMTSFDVPVEYEYITRRPITDLRKVVLKIINVWIHRYITKEVLVFEDPLSKEFVFYTKSLLFLIRIEQMLDQIALKGYVSRFDWISPEEYFRLM